MGNQEELLDPCGRVLDFEGTVFLLLRSPTQTRLIAEWEVESPVI